MVREDYSNKSKIVKQGGAFFFRPKGDTEALEDLKDIQRFYMVITQEKRVPASSVLAGIFSKLLSWIDCSKSKKGLKGDTKDHFPKGQVKNKVGLLSSLERLPFKKYSNYMQEKIGPIK